MTLLLGRSRTVSRAVLIATLTVLLVLLALTVPPRPPAQALGAPDDPGAPYLILLDEPAAFAGLPAGTIDASGRPSAEALRLVSVRRAEVAAEQDAVLDRIRASGAPVTERRTLTDLVDALAVSMKAGDVERVEQLPGVRAVLPDEQVRTTTDLSVPLVGAPEVWKRTAPDGTPVRGAGTTVAIIDSGVDYTNPSLGAGFGPGHKVVDGYDLVDDDEDPMDTDGHGTHVAGIVAADGAVTGMAPEAELTAYRVTSDDAGQVSDAIAALELAADPAAPHRADVVNLSLAAPGDGTDPFSEAAAEVVDLGIVVVAAAGNAGPGPMTVSAPALGRGVISVGASVSGMWLPVAKQVTPRQRDIQAFRAPYSAYPPARAVTAELVDVGQGKPADYEQVGDVTGKVVAFRASIPPALEYVSPALIQQAKEAEDRGAVAALGYTSSGGPVLQRQEEATQSLQSGESFRMDRLVVLGLHDLQWEALRTDLAKGPVRVQISGTDATDQMAGFSSRGPAPDFGLEPDLVAPGVEIRSTWPLAQWAPGVYRISGTSMASPHVAGAAALLTQLDPDSAGQTIAARLTGSAKILDADPTAQGAGRLDVAAAASATLTASPTSVDLGLADLGEPRVRANAEVTIHNDADNPVSLELEVRPGPSSVGRVTAAVPSITVPAHGQATVGIRARAPRSWEDSDVSGWLVARPQGGGQSLSVPYLLALRPMIVRASPDPSDGRSEAFVYSPSELSAPPEVVVEGPRGGRWRVPTTLDHSTWYRAPLDADAPGTYRLTVEGTTTTGVQLVGRGSWEVVHGAAGPGWEPVGPNSEGGRLSVSLDEGRAAMSQPTALGPWLTDDHGETWRRTPTWPVAAGRGEGVVSATEPGTAWYAVNGRTGGLFDEVLDPTYQGRLLRTTDAGDTWQVLDFPNVHIDALVREPTSDGLLAVTQDSLWASTDAGDTWREWPRTVSAPLVGAALVGDDALLATSAEVVRIPALLFGTPGPAEVLHTSPAGDRISGLVADAELTAVLQGGSNTVWGSRDGGAWQSIFSAGLGTQWISLDRGLLVVSTYRGYEWMSHDHGATWTQVTNPQPGSIPIDAHRWGDGLLWSAPGGGLYRTTAEGAQPQRIAVQGSTAYDIAVTERPGAGPTLLAGTDRDVYDTPLPTGPVTPATAEWGLSGKEATFGAVVGQVEVSAHHPEVVWRVRKAATGQFYVYRSNDGGATWTQRGVTSEVPFALYVHPDDPDQVVVAFGSLKGSGLFVTRDGGTTWRKVVRPGIVNDLAGDPEHPGRLWIASTEGTFSSDDLGETWTLRLDGPARAVAVSGNRVVVGDRSIRFSTDSGSTFRTADVGGLPLQVADLAFAPGSQGAIYAASRGYSANGLVQGGRGVLRSTDGGREWGNISEGLQTLSVQSLMVTSDGQWLFAGTTQGGVHRLDLR